MPIEPCVRGIEPRAVVRARVTVPVSSESVRCVLSLCRDTSICRYTYSFCFRAAAQRLFLCVWAHNRKHIKDEDCSKIIKGILLGLKHLHRHDVVHRDLKPSNVVLADADQLEKVKLVDFGLAVKY